MKSLIIVLALCTAGLQGQIAQKPVVEFELMTWREIQKAIHEEGKINVIVYNGGTEQRGPQNVTGGHNLMGRETARAIALKLGNAIVAPVMPFTVNEATPDLPGTIGLTGPIFAAVNERVAEQLIVDGFKNVFLMGDHGGGQKEMGEVAKKLDVKYAPRGIHVYFCGEMYTNAQGDYIKWLGANGYGEAAGGHAGAMDTSEMLYLGGDKGWVRKDLMPTVDKDPKNGIFGDARRTSLELGKRIFDMKVDYAVRQINQYLSAAAK